LCAEKGVLGFKKKVSYATREERVKKPRGSEEKRQVGHNSCCRKLGALTQ